MSPLLRLIGRGAAAGAVAGALSVVVSFLLGEPYVSSAIALEQAGGGPGEEVFSRGTQLFGLVVVSLLIGVAIGILFGAVYAIVHRQDPDADPWRRAIRLAAAGFVGVSLIPFLRYPANPPAVGDPGTVDARTRLYLLAILVGLAAVTAAWQLHRALLARGAAEPLRQLAVVGIVLLGVAATFLLPGVDEPTAAPADLIWGFRVASLATLATLWFGLGAAFGLLGERASRAVDQPEPSEPVAG